MKKPFYPILFIAFVFSGSCSIEKLYAIRQKQKIYVFEQIEFGDIVKKYLNKNKSSLGTIEGVYSVSSLVTKKGKGFLSTTEKEKVVSRSENYAKVAIIHDGQNSEREYLEIPIEKGNMPSYSIRGEFTGMSEGNILIYKHLESRGKTTTYTFTYDKARDILEGVRTENNGSFTYLYTLTYIKLYPKASEAINK